MCSYPEWNREQTHQRTKCLLVELLTLTVASTVLCKFSMVSCCRLIDFLVHTDILQGEDCTVDSENAKETYWQAKLTACKLFLRWVNMSSNWCPSWVASTSRSVKKVGSMGWGPFRCCKKCPPFTRHHMTRHACEKVYQSIIRNRSWRWWQSPYSSGKGKVWARQQMGHNCWLFLKVHLM